jgi:hypothetical protein
MLAAIFSVLIAVSAMQATSNDQNLQKAPTNLQAGGAGVGPRAVESKKAGASATQLPATAKPQTQSDTGKPSSDSEEIPGRVRNAWGEAFSPNTWSSWALVVVGILTAIAALLTLSAIRTQAAIMRDQTDATQRSVELFANAERARIAIQVSRLGNLSLQFDAKNIGRTTARIIDSACFCVFVDRGKSLPDTPEYVALDDTRELEATDSLAAGESFSLVRRSANSDGSGIAPFLIADLSADATRHNIGYHGHSMWVYGRIRYFDEISGAAREHRFCFKILSDGDRETWARLEGPPAYRMVT